MFALSKSYPYLSIARHLDLPYWVVLCWDDPGVWGRSARLWAHLNASNTTHLNLRSYLDQAPQ